MMKKVSVDKNKQIVLVNNDDGHSSSRVYNQQGIALVMMMKKILEKVTTCDESVSELEVCEVLRRLESMELTFKTLEATKIGITVNALKKKYASEKVRNMAVRLVKEWKRTVDETFKKQSEVVVIVEPKSVQLIKPTNVKNLNREKKLASFEKATKIGNIDGVKMDSLKATKSLQLKSSKKTEEKKLEVNSEKISKIGNTCGSVNIVMMDSKLEATKRKLQEGYEKVENLKKKRRIQVMELHELTKYGLLPQMKKKPIKRQMCNIWRRR